MSHGPDRVPRVLVAAGWVAAAGLVLLGRIAAPLRPARPPAPATGPVSGPALDAPALDAPTGGAPTGRLSDGLPPLAPFGPRPAAPLAARPDAPGAARATASVPPSPAPAAPVPVGGETGPREAALAGGRRAPLRILADVEAAFAARDSAPRGRDRMARLLPRPLAGLRMAASPLIMPRLALPRALAPDFRALRDLAARARPGEPVHVKLTAYCLNGATRQGTHTRPGVIAADPRLFPLAHHVELYAAGRHLGRFRVEDTGGAVRGPHIDIWTPDCDDAERFGTRAGVAALVAPSHD